MGVFDRFFSKETKGVDFYPTKALALMSLFNKSKDFNLKRECIRELESLGDKDAISALSRILKERITEAASLYSLEVYKGDIFPSEQYGLKILPPNRIPASGENMGNIVRSRNLNIELSLICVKSLLNLRDMSAIDYIKITIALASHKMTQDIREAQESGDAELCDLTVMANEALSEQIRLIEDEISKVNGKTG